VGDVVTAAGIGEQLVEQVAMLVAVPEMMMWVNDLERRLQNLLFPLRPPRRVAVARSGRRIAGDGSSRTGLRARRGWTK
jgi:hypothetical protein